MDEGLEARIGELIAARRYEDAATEALRGYGPGVYRFLVGRTRSEDRAGEVFAQLGEDLWRSIEGFRGESAFMTWMYTLARNAAHRFERAPHNQARRHATISKLDQVVRDVRERTAPHLRTEVKDRFHALRESLAPDERTLLHLRVDQDLDWREVARIVEGEAALHGPELERATARVRKRFSDLKRRLRERAAREGLIGEEDPG